MSKNSKISVTIITGFLGAGKTTFINSILKQYPETQFALVENEFGEISIDTKLIKGVDVSRMFELKQGCICCTITDEFELVLQELAEWFPNVEHLLIETTGIADPGPVIRPFFSNEKLKKLYRFNGTVCLVDSIHFYNLSEKEITLKQISVADTVLVNKSEILTREQINRIQNELYQINPLAEIMFSEFGFAPDFNLNAMEHREKLIPDFTTELPVHSKITSKAIKIHQTVNRERITEWLSYNLDIYKNEIYRVKGILCFDDEPYEYILQGVGGSFEITEGDLLIEKTKSVLVFIGILENINLQY